MFPCHQDKETCMTNSHSGPARPLQGLGLLFGGMLALQFGQRALHLSFIAPVQLSILAIFAAAALWLPRRYWLAIDEAARDAQKTAWFWGGSLAIIPGGLLLMIL